MNRLSKLVLASALLLPCGMRAGVELSAPGDTYIFYNTLCSEVDLSEVTVMGRPFNPEVDRLSIYGNGAIVVAEGWTDPLVIYSEPGCQGESKTLDYDKYYRGELQGDKSYLAEEELGSFDNNVRSFRLKKGFSCTLANASDGTGFSRVFIADNEDLVVDEMPEGLEWVSFVRVCRFDWVGKRGMAGGDPTAITRSSWFYDWGAGATSTQDYEYIPMRHNRWWDSWENIGSRTETSSLLGLNEPDHADQSDLSPQQAIEMWPEMLKSGLRLGSPAPDCINKQWLKDFLTIADSLNYRVDFVATHMYWDSQNPYSLANSISDLCQRSYGGRPMWITEWNNGANWTTEWWPDAKGPRRDAEFNIIYDENGNTTEVSRPHTEANSAKQCEWLLEALDAFDKCDWLERHAFYNWVEDARAVEINGKLTPAGGIFTDFDSRPAFNRSTEYIHKWKPVPPKVTGINWNKNRTRISFYDTNGETAECYIVQRRVNRGKWREIARIYPSEDYKMYQDTYFLDTDYQPGLNQYRIRALSYKGTESIWSRMLGVNIADTGVEEITSASGMTAYKEGGMLVTECETAGRYPLYSVDGKRVSWLDCPAGRSEHPLPDPGLYILAGQRLKL